MPWTPGRWPRPIGAPAEPRDLNEILDVLGERVGISQAAYHVAANDPTAAAVDAIRARVNLYLSDAFCDPATGYPWRAIGETEILTGAYGSRRRNIFTAALGAPHLSWPNTPELDSTQHLTWGQLPYAFLANHLQTVVDLLGWIGLDLGAIAAAGRSYKTQSTLTRADRQTAVDDGHAAWLALSPTGGSASGATFSSLENLTWDSSASWWCSASRSFWPFSMPAGAILSRAILYGIQDNYYYRATGGSPAWETVKPPDWTASLRIGTADPAPFGAEDWAYGSLGCSFGVSEYAYAGIDLATPVAADLANWTADATNRVQLVADDEVKPQFLVDDGYWGSDTYCGRVRRLGHWLRILYRLA